MSVSQVIQNLRAQEQANVDKALAQQEFVNELLSAIPADTPGKFEVHRGGYCAEAYMVFSSEGEAAEALTRRLYELYPPLDCVDLKGSTQSQKPLKYVRDEDRYDSQRPIFPVLVKTERSRFQGREQVQHAARWWTNLAGHDVEIKVKGGSLEGFKDVIEGRFVADSQSYPGGHVSFLPRALVKPTVRPGAMVSWLADWTEFAQANQFCPNGSKFLAKLSQLLAKLSPAAAPPDLMSATAEEAKYVMPEAQDPFRQFFTPEQQAVVAAFAKEQHQKLGAAREQQEQDFQTVRQWFTDFFGRFGFYNENDTEVTHRILHKLRKDTGLDVSVRIMRPTPHTGVSLDVCFKGWEEYVGFTVPFSKADNPPRVKAQDIEVEYVA